METESFFFLVESQMVLESTKNKLTQRKEKKKKEWISLTIYNEENSLEFVSSNLLSSLFSRLRAHNL